MLEAEVSIRDRDVCEINWHFADASGSLVVLKMGYAYNGNPDSVPGKIKHFPTHLFQNVLSCLLTRSSYVNVRVQMPSSRLCVTCLRVWDVIDPSILFSISTLTPLADNSSKISEIQYGCCWSTNCWYDEATRGPSWAYETEGELCAGICSSERRSTQVFFVVYHVFCPGSWM